MAEGMMVAKREAQRAAEPVAPAIAEIVIGKDVLELVSSAMYIDPLTIYREYIQNAADAIDDARQTGLLPLAKPGRVEIDFDTATRRVLIRDNGSGLGWPNFVRRMTSLGASSKRGGTARGFRGVGRLAGLGYAQQLIFRSRADGERLVSELTWDCRALRAALRSIEEDEGVAEAIRRVVSIARLDGPNYPNRFFEVEIKGVVRLRSDKLMSPSAVADYLAQVAPVPFAPEFPFSETIRAALSPVVRLADLDVRISGLEGPIYRPHRKEFVENKRQVRFEDVEVVRIPGVDGGDAAVGWLLHHEYDGAVPIATGFKGLRLRGGNIQVGGHALLEELFSEPRFNAWSIGEIHVVDPRIVPNARRDDFEQNAHYNNLLNQLSPIARSIAKRCRTNSKRRQLLRDFQIQQTTVEERLAIMAQGSLRRSAREAQAANVDQALIRMTKFAEAVELATDRKKLLETVEKLRKRVRASDWDPQDSPLAKLPPRRRAMYRHLFDLIYGCSTNRVAAKALIDRILAKIYEDMSAAKRRLAKRPVQRSAK